MQLSDLDYYLPAELIAQRPLYRRDASRMLVVDRAKRVFSDHNFVDLGHYLQPSDVLVLNDTKVFPARVEGRTETGAIVEIFLVRELDRQKGVWEALAKPLKRLKTGKRVKVGENASFEITAITDEGRAHVRSEFDGGMLAMLERFGLTPLPPYIRRGAEECKEDRERYQTVYARATGAVAAPTAGLHFTRAFLDSLRSRGVTITEVTLNVGYGTFEPVRVDDISRHCVKPEQYSISAETAEILNQAKLENRRIVAVGTTTTRALEHAIAARGEFKIGTDIADLTIIPGYKFRAIDALLTNFHLPKSSLLILVSTFAERELIMRAYEHAVAARYRFYSYGDCMFIV